MRRNSMQKKNVMIRIDSEIVETAKELGLSISKYCENALINGINALIYADTGKGLRRVPGVPSAKLVLRPGFEPGSAAFFRCWRREAVIHGPFHV